MNYSKEMIGAGILIDICGAVKYGERVVIATDQEKLEIANIMFEACLSRRIEPILISMVSRKHHGEEPPKPYAATLMYADVVFAVTSFSLFHTNARIEACKKGVRWVNLPEYSKKMLCEGGLFVDFHRQREKANKVGEVLSKGNIVQVTTNKGTNIIFSINGRKAIIESGISDQPGMVNSPPDIEVCIAPIEGTAEGIIVIDGSIVLPGLGPLKEDVIAYVSRGMLKNIEGLKDAILFKKILDMANDDTVFNIGEFGVGLNPKCRICGSMLEDEGVYGTVHFGLGDNHTIGGLIDSSMHTDVVITKPTVLVDEQILIKEGEIIGI